MAAPRVLRKFPLSLGIGTDICHVVRIQRILKSPKATRFVQKILTTEERAHPKIQWLLSHQNHPPRSSQDGRIQPMAPERGVPDSDARDAQGEPSISQGISVAATFVAGRFAAKEAVIKAHPHRALTWHDITIQSQAATHLGRRGAPLAIIRGENKDHEALVSISHDGEYATAMCVGAGETQ